MPIRNHDEDPPLPPAAAVRSKRLGGRLATGIQARHGGAGQKCLDDVGSAEQNELSGWVLRKQPTHDLRAAGNSFVAAP